MNNRNSMRKNTLIGLGVVVGLAVVGSILMSKDSDPKVENTQTNIKETTTPTLPSEVTDNFPTYSGAEVSNVTNSTSDDGRIFYSVSLESEDDIATINTWYRDAFSQNGWVIKGDNNVGGYQIIKGEKDNLVSSMQAAKTDDGKVRISQQIQIRPE